MIDTKITDEIYMRRALSLAVLGRGMTSPNPMVGCVIVKNGSIIGQGWHHKCGEAHAEIEALNDAFKNGNDVRGSCLYVNLEPCSHFGRTPPCAARLIREGVARVVIGAGDQNELVNGRGIKMLREAGIEVVEHCLENEARWLNRGFIRVHKDHRPWVTLKAASSLDGKMALKNGESKWITGLEARTEAHSMRAENDAVMVGIGTVLKDNPELTVRHVKGKNPLRIVIDPKLLIPADAKVIGSKHKHDRGCLILTSEDSRPEKIKLLESAGAKIVKLACENGHMDLKTVLEYLADSGILSLMVEGGPGVLNSFIKSGLADWLSVFFSPKILGDGPGLGNGLSFNCVSDAIKLKDVKSKKLGQDILMEGRFECSPDL